MKILKKAIRPAIALALSLATAAPTTGTAATFDAAAFRAKAAQINREPGIRVILSYANNMLITAEVDDTVFQSWTAFGTKTIVAGGLRDSLCTDYAIGDVLDGKTTVVEVYLASPHSKPKRMITFMQCPGDDSHLPGAGRGTGTGTGLQ